MSRVGKTIIQIPAGVTVEYDGSLTTVTGSKGVLTQEIKAPISVVVEGGFVHVKRGNDEAQSRALHGLYNRLIQNMIVGVTQGFTKTLILNGVGYKANLRGEDLVLNLGMSHPCEVKAEAGVKFKILAPAEVQALNLGKDGIGVVIQVSGTNKEKVGAMASRIRDLRPVEPYHMYGIRYSNEHVIRKESKSGKKSGGKK
jgi:large subunit ribosomal protein L6